MLKINLYSEWVSQVQDHLKDMFHFSTWERLSTNYTWDRLSVLVRVFRTAFIQTRRGSISHAWVVSHRFFTSQVRWFSTPESLRDKNLPCQELQDSRSFIQGYGLIPNSLHASIMQNHFHIPKLSEKLYWLKIRLKPIFLWPQEVHKVC